jgi:hypothetical protein
MRLQAKVRLIEAIRDALGEAEDVLHKEAQHLGEVGWYTRAQDFFDGADALDALNKHNPQ